MSASDRHAYHDQADWPEPLTPTQKVERAETELGHDLEYDPPFGITAAQRWTCKRCGHAVLNYRGNVYGSATERPCGP